MRYLILFLLLSCPFYLLAQVDSTYISSHKKQYGVKINGSNDILVLDYIYKGKEKYKFQSNRPFSVGVGFLWGTSSLSFNQGFSYLKDSKKGKTKSTDFQYHHYGDKFLIDLYFKQYKGFYLNEEKASQDILKYPDLRINMYGALYQYVFNNTRYSLAAANDQSKRQLKSAGTLLIGGSFFYSTLRNIPDFDETYKDYEKKTYQFGPNVGYGYNWVLWDDLLLAGSITFGINGTIEENLLTKNTHFVVNPTMGARLSIGYYKNDWVFSATSIINGIYLDAQHDYQSNLLATNFVFSVMKRFDLKKEIPFLQNGFKFKRGKVDNAVPVT